MGELSSPVPGAVEQARLMSCSDFAGRHRTVMVFADHGQVVIVAPPAEVAIMTGDEVDQLCAALIQAKFESAQAEQAR